LPSVRRMQCFVLQGWHPSYQHKNRSFLCVPSFSCRLSLWWRDCMLVIQFIYLATEFINSFRRKASSSQCCQSKQPWIIPISVNKQQKMRHKDGLTILPIKLWQLTTFLECWLSPVTGIRFCNIKKLQSAA